MRSNTPLIMAKQSVSTAIVSLLRNVSLCPQHNLRLNVYVKLFVHVCVFAYTMVLYDLHIRLCPSSSHDMGGFM